MRRVSYVRVTERNRRKIQEAFAELLAERGLLRNITVTELARRADVTRGTFYNYYDNIYQVGAELQNEIEKRLFSEYDNLTTVEDVENYIDEVFVFLRSQEDIYGELLFSDASAEFLRQLENGMDERVSAVLHKNGIDNKAVELDLLFLINGAVAIVRRYYRKEVDLSLDEIRDYLKEKIRGLFSSIGDKILA